MATFDFDEVIAKTKEAANSAAKKSSEVFEVSKKKLAASETGRKMQKNYAALGALYYDSIKNDVDLSAQMEPIVEEISFLQMELDEIQAEILNLQNAVVCKACSSKNPKDHLFCAKCGEKL